MCQSAFQKYYFDCRVEQLLEKRSILQLIWLEGENTRNRLKKLDKVGLLQRENLKLNILEENDSHLSKYIFTMRKTW